MKKVICTTTINPPTEALIAFSKMEGWDLVIAGDLKTPHDAYATIPCQYLSPEVQTKLYPDLSDAIGWNCIQRRNIAFVFALKELGADLIATVDDDNIPLEDWGRCFDRPTRMYITDDEAFDPFSGTIDEKIWHRGFPIQRVANRSPLSWETAPSDFTADIMASLVQGDPDVDAICRMIFAPYATGDAFDAPFCANKPAPFNSQNTILKRAVMPHYFMFPFIGRMDDIWAAFHVQAVGFRVVFDKASVSQVRNPHDLITDMKAEYLGYEHNLSICQEIVAGNENAVLDRLSVRALRAFDLYQKLLR